MDIAVYTQLSVRITAKNLQRDESEGLPLDPVSRQRGGSRRVVSSHGFKRGDQMNDRFARYGAATGILFVIFVVIGFAITPTPPANDATPAEVLGYVADHHSALHAVQLIFAAAGFFFIWFIGTLRDALSRVEVREGRHALANTAWGGGLIA